jgi:ferredoxin-type protein NapF
MKKFFQVFFLGAFTLLFFLSFLPHYYWGPINYYFRTDPLIAIISMVASRRIIPPLFFSLLLLAFTAGIGRFFCAYLCPLGAIIDGSDFIFFKKKGEFRRQNIYLKRFKYYLLILLVSAALTGLSLVYFLDPLVILGRFYTFFLYPLSVLIINKTLDIIRPVASLFEWNSLVYLSYIQPLFYSGFITLMIFFTIILLGAIAPRFWCRNLCPLGAMLSIFSRFGVFKRRVNDDCNDCMVCVNACPMDAIERENPRKTRFQECIQCLTCQKICPQQAISFPLSIKNSYPSDFNLSRRGFLSSIGTGLAASFLILTTPKSRFRSERLIRPPGAIPEEVFNQTCLRCSQCLEACLTNTLQPSIWEAGLKGLWTPRMDLRYAGCEQNCNRCGKVCPSQAIRSLDLEEKKHAKVGTAVIDRDLCLVWRQDQICLICDEACPYNAIVFKEVNNLRRPFVIENKCNGCGYCENRCPIEGRSAIVVYPHGEIRLLKGSYRAEACLRKLDIREDSSYDYF